MSELRLEALNLAVQARFVAAYEGHDVTLARADAFYGWLLHGAAVLAAIEAAKAKKEVGVILEELRMEPPKG